ncbi:hypothetical protein CAPTEDRAFT_115178, partial [Capitella teleta]
SVIFNSSNQSDYIPSCWKRANVVPIHQKKGLRIMCPITDIFHFYALPAKKRCVFNHSYPLVENRLHPVQHGFTKGR